MTGVTRSALPEPTAPRLRTPSWRDPRLLFGILLVAGSVVLGSWAVTAGQQTVGIYQVTETLPPGAELSSENLTVVQIRSADVQNNYLMAADDLPTGQITMRVLGRGEFVPHAAIATTAELEQRPVAVPVGPELSATVQVGSTVDLWFVPQSARSANATSTTSEQLETPQPSELAKGLVVSEVTGESGGLIAGSGSSVHVLVPQDDLADVLGALAAQGTVSLVPSLGVKSDEAY